MAVAQTEEIARLWSNPDLGVEIVKFQTKGYRDQTSRLLRHGGKGGAFVVEIRSAMHDGEPHLVLRRGVSIDKGAAEIIARATLEDV